jgi:hypothetical protein
MADWTYGTPRDEHLDEHNQYDHTDLASLTEGQVLGVAGGVIKQVFGTSLAAFITGTTYQVVDGDTVLLVDTTANAVTVTLALASAMDRQSILIKRVAGSNAVTINRAGSDQVDTDGATATSKSLDGIGASWSASALASSSRWYTIGEHGTVT